MKFWKHFKKADPGVKRHMRISNRQVETSTWLLLHVYGDVSSEHRYADVPLSHLVQLLADKNGGEFTLFRVSPVGVKVPVYQHTGRGVRRQLDDTPDTLDLVDEVEVSLYAGGWVAQYGGEILFGMSSRARAALQQERWEKDEAREALSALEETRQQAIEKWRAAQSAPNKNGSNGHVPEEPDWLRSEPQYWSTP